MRRVGGGGGSGTKGHFVGEDFVCVMMNSPVPPIKLCNILVKPLFGN